MTISAIAPRMLPIILLLGISACSRKEPAAETDTMPPAADTSRPESREPDSWALTETGIGPYRVGMTLAEARAAGDGLMVTDSMAPCYYARPKGGPAGVSLMMAEGRIARVDIDSTVVTTAAGARAGDTEDRIRELYPGAVESTPHKYITGGHYLTVTPAPGGNRIVFETDGKVVTRFRGGRLPEVGWIEGCS